MSPESAARDAPAGLFAGGGELGARMARLDWARTPLGAVPGWPQSLRAAVRIVLSSRYPMLLLWGPDYTQLYNDAYSALIGDQHPAALGGDVRVTLEAGWDVLEPLIAEAMATGVASWVPALRLLLERAGFREEAYFSVSHAPARDDSGRTVGVLTVCSEVTEQVVGERRLRLLHDLALHGGGRTDSVIETTRRLAAAIAEHPLDIPFAAIYLHEGAGLRLAAATDHHLPLGTPDADATRAGLRVLDAPAGLDLPGGPWGDPVRTLVTVPLPSGDPERPLGVLLAATSPSRGLDEGYTSFLELLGQQVSVAVRNSLAYDQERRRAETLAELDRVKTAFFTNVSHEFRTPLTLLLGPLADALADAGEPLGPRQRARVEVARRNATRLHTLVDNLLTFSALEAGRATSTAREVDLAGLTAGLAAVFRAAVERAAVRLVVDCPPLPRRTALDPAHWETIVTNLISNALKFTFTGEIRVTLDSDDQAVRLHVADTGIGIAPEDQTHLFDRFHRVQGARSRSHEGSGIGLALVRELSRLLGGDVTVAAAPGRGSTFTVTLPWQALDPPATTPPPAAAPPLVDASPPAAATPLAAAPTLAAAGEPGQGGTGQEDATTPGRAAQTPAEQAPGQAAQTPAEQAPGRAAQALAEEAAGWLADPEQGSRHEEAATSHPISEMSRDSSGNRDGDRDGREAPARILVADDNADMRAYLVGLLSDQGWQVRGVPDGRAALDAVRREQPDLLVTDVMMPGLDGIALIRELRRDAATRALPVLVLSARAGGEAGAEGIEAGADDYLVKPFAAADLIARVRGALRRGQPPAAGAPRPGGNDRMRPDAAGAGPATPVSPRPAVPGQPPGAPGKDEAGVDVVHEWTYPLTPTASSAMRQDLRAALDGAVDDEDLLQDLLVAATEAVNNAVEHAQRPARPGVDVSLRLGGGLIRLSVRDYGTWRARPAPADRGRGALLMNAYGDVTVTSTAAGTLVEIERAL